MTEPRHDGGIADLVVVLAEIEAIAKGERDDIYGSKRAAMADIAAMARAAVLRATKAVA